VTRRPDVIVVGGPTAGGKSALALALAQQLGGELVGADSRQLYAGLSIASAGPTEHERARVRHHLYGTVAPVDTLSAGRFVALADAAISDVVGRGRVAIVVGGTGLYLRALRCGLDEPLPGDATLRARLVDDLRAYGLPSLVERLRDLDDAALDGLDVQNPMRVLRALELAVLGGRVGRRDVDAVLRRPPRATVERACWLLVSREPSTLAARIEQRARSMFSSRAIIDEAVALSRILPADHALLQTIGTAEALAVARGASDIDAAIAQTATRTRQYARRQRTWFKKEPWWTPVDTVADAALDDAVAETADDAGRAARAAAPRCAHGADAPVGLAQALAIIERAAPR
jgi:tRNA dimethylallyltransferase